MNNRKVTPTFIPIIIFEKSLPLGNEDIAARVKINTEYVQSAHTTYLKQSPSGKNFCSQTLRRKRPTPGASHTRGHWCHTALSFLTPLAVTGTRPPCTIRGQVDTSTEGRFKAYELPDVSSVTSCKRAEWWGSVPEDSSLHCSSHLQHSGVTWRLLSGSGDRRDSECFIQTTIFRVSTACCMLTGQLVPNWSNI